jgi:hypothetical protein
MSIFLGAIKKRQKTFVFGVYTDNRKGKEPLLFKIEKIKRVNEKSAIDFMENKYSNYSIGENIKVKIINSY